MQIERITLCSVIIIYLMCYLIEKLDLIVINVIIANKIHKIKTFLVRFISFLHSINLKNENLLADE